MADPIEPLKILMISHEPYNKASLLLAEMRDIVRCTQEMPYGMGWGRVGGGVHRVMHIEQLYRPFELLEITNEVQDNDTSDSVENSRELVRS